jgi:polyphosphate kinase 2
MGQEDWKPGSPGEGVVGECPKFEAPEGRESWYTDSGNLKRSVYSHHLRLLQEELVKLQEWIKHEKLNVVVIFEGRDASGKGGVIKRIAERLNPRVARISALPTPTEREKTQWYFQRYVSHLPAGGEMVIFDRSWYNRAGVERVMEFCTREEFLVFARSVPEFERMLVRSGITLVKYWFSVSDEEQERRFQARLHNPMKRWKLSPMDLESRRLYREYSRAKDEMFKFSDIKQARRSNTRTSCRIRWISRPGTKARSMSGRPSRIRASSRRSTEGLRHAA